MQELLAQVIKEWIIGDTPEEIDELMKMCRIITITKKNGKLRPIQIGITLRRIAMKAVVSTEKEKLQQAVGNSQFAYGRV